MAQQAFAWMGGDMREAEAAGYAHYLKKRFGTANVRVAWRGGVYSAKVERRGAASVASWRPGERPPVEAMAAELAAVPAWRPAKVEAPAALPLPEAATAKSRDSRRSKRKHPVRERSESMVRLPKHEREMNRLEVPDWVLDAIAEERPKTRAECPPKAEDGRRRCGFCACKWHLKYEINVVTGSIKDRFPGLDVDQMKDTCALDVADEGGATLERLAEATGCTRERMRQLEQQAIEALPHWGKALLESHVATENEAPPRARRRLPVVPDESADPLPADVARSPGRVRQVAPVDDRGVNWPARERALLRTAARLGRFTAAGLLRASGLPVDDLGPVHRMQAEGLLRRDGGELVATEELASVVRNGYVIQTAAE